MRVSSVFFCYESVPCTFSPFYYQVIRDVIKVFPEIPAASLKKTPKVGKKKRDEQIVSAMRKSRLRSLCKNITDVVSKSRMSYVFGRADCN